MPFIRPTHAAALLVATFLTGVAVQFAAAAVDDARARTVLAPIGDVYTPPLLDGATALDAKAFEEVKDLNERLTPHLIVGDDGLVRLSPDITADQLGVSEEFLANFREALVYSNQAISAGHIKVDSDLTVVTADDFDPTAVVVDPGLVTDPVVNGVMSDEVTPDGALPEWGAWGYPNGAIFFNSYSDWVYYRHSYYGLCNTMAAYLRLPWMSRSLVYFYGYNSPYFSSYCYNPAGVYWYMPYNHCQTGLGYKPGYFWARTYAFNSACRCYQYQWAWQGFWCRY